ncbi:hypothetical protein BV22DRAFT_1118083 [Leucogyrophana mollusca]|uniref:Uncharacterized protein n=1 Tax=Leucogyrophana mollusca TaxID=85980 RepID=A0ACB8BPR6_9AGAM|nr:hypothetical protein BV22DRAFT_1118083 [Leucogyrophana mollusca]
MQAHGDVSRWSPPHRDIHTPGQRDAVTAAMSAYIDPTELRVDSIKLSATRGRGLCATPSLRRPSPPSSAQPPDLRDLVSGVRGAVLKRGIRSTGARDVDAIPVGLSGVLGARGGYTDVSGARRGYTDVPGALREDRDWEGGGGYHRGDGQTRETFLPSCNFVLVEDQTWAALVPWFPSPASSLCNANRTQSESTRFQPSSPALPQHSVYGIQRTHTSFDGALPVSSASRRSVHPTRGMSLPVTRPVFATAGAIN